MSEEAHILPPFITSCTWLGYFYIAYIHSMERSYFCLTEPPQAVFASPRPWSRKLLCRFAETKWRSIVLENPSRKKQSFMTLGYRRRSQVETKAKFLTVCHALGRHNNPIRREQKKNQHGMCLETMAGLLSTLLILWEAHSNQGHRRSWGQAG